MRVPVLRALIGATVFGTVPVWPREAMAQEAVTVFVDVSVVPMDRERVLSHQTVIVRGDRIAVVGPARRVRVPAGATTVDGRGKFLLPGLADMHVHPGGRDTTILQLYLANGITTIRSPGGSPVGDPVSEWRRRVAAGQLLGPRIYTAGSVTAWNSPRLAAEEVAEVKRGGHDAIKLPAGGQPGEAAGEVYDSILAAARRVRLPIIGHVPVSRPLEDVLRSGQWASIEHLTGYVEYVAGVSGRLALNNAGEWFGLDHERLLDTAAWIKPGFNVDAPLRRIVQLTRQNGVWNCPTLVIYEVLNARTPAEQANLVALVRGSSQSPQPPSSSATVRASQWLFEFGLRTTKALQDGGAGLLLGTDEDPFAIHRELQLLVQAGLTPYQALSTGTRNVAIFLGTLDSTGTVAAGKRADLVLLSGNPLKDIRYTAGPAGVMVGGRWISRAQIDAQVDALGLRARRDKAWGIRPDTGR